MSVTRIEDVAFGAELPGIDTDTSLVNVRDFAAAVGWSGGRFDSHELARKEGLPGALVPGILGMGFFTAMIHRWSSNARLERIDTVFRAPLLADEPCHLSAVVTDIDTDSPRVELDLTIRNDAGETRVIGTATVRL